MKKPCLFISLLAVLLFTGNARGATYIVSRTAPDDNNPGSLRWCMNSANFNAGAPDTIIFQIPGTGPFTIFPDSQLPILTDPAGVLIDGLSQTGASAGGNPPSTATLMIIIDGSNAGPAHGIWIMSPDNFIQGLVVSNFEQDGIRIQATPGGTNMNTVYCNYVGTDYQGMNAMGNGWNQNMYWAGIYIICTPSLPGIAYGNHILNNLVSANYAEGVGIANCPPGDVAFNIVFQNYIGTNMTGVLDLGNAHDGVYIGEGAHDNAIDENLISGNDFEGVCIIGYDDLQIYTYGNIAYNNIIGLSVVANPLPNTMDGVSIGQYGNIYNGGFATDNIIDSNTIARNGANGVTVWEHPMNAVNADHNWITRNSMYLNNLIGIDLGDDLVTTNDAGDPDNGPNEEVNFPDITSAQYFASTQTVVDGTIDIDTDDTLATVEVFRAWPDTGAPPYGEGITYLGATTPDSTGYWTITVAGLSVGDEVTATTTDMNFNTSEFCQNVTVVLGVAEGYSRKPVNYALDHNIPNPFSKFTVIQYALPKKMLASLRIYDVAGKLVKILTSGLKDAGEYTIYWNGTDESGDVVSAGVYLYTLDTKEFKSTRKMIFTR